MGQVRGRDTSSSSPEQQGISKRLRVAEFSASDDEFKPGAIRRVALHNFVTYSDVVFTPAPGLNLIIGPNGSGKSSIVCALCLGLGGNTSSLGRATQVGDYIKRGDNISSGYVEIDLHTPGTTAYKPNRTVVRRRIKLNNQSVWKIDGRVSSLSEVKELVVSLNIQVDNLCQFLAQEKVSDFAKIDPINLLKQTELAVEDSSLREQHEQLISLHKALKSFESQMASLELQTTRLQTQEANLAKEVQRFEAREEFLKKIDLLEKKLPWLRYQGLRNEARKVKEELTEAQQHLKSLQQQQQPLQQKIVEMEAEHNAAAQSVKDRRLQIRTLSGKIDQFRNKIEEAEDKAIHTRNELDRIEEDERNRERNLEKLKSDEADLKLKIDEIMNDEDVLQKLAIVRRQHEEGRRRSAQMLKRVSTLNNSISNLERLESQRKKEIEDMQSVSLRRQRALTETSSGLTKKGRDALRLRDWLQKGEGKHLCSGRVFGPIALEIDVKRKGTEKYVERAIAYDLKLAFVVETDQDFRLLSEKKREWNLGNTIISAEGMSMPGPRPDLPRGFAYLSNAVSGPDLVLMVLSEMNTLSSVYSLKSSLAHPERHLAQSAKDQGFRSLYIGNSLYSVRFSRYGSHNRSTSLIEVPPASLFIGTVDEAKIHELRREMQKSRDEYEAVQTERKECEQQRFSIQKSDRELTVEIGRLESMGKVRNALNRRLKLVRSKIQQHSSTVDVDELKQEVFVELRNLSKSRAHDAHRLLTLSMKTMQVASERDSFSLASVHTKEVLRVLEQQLKKETFAYQEAIDGVASLKAALKSAAGSAKVQRNIAERRAPLAEYEVEFREASWMPGEETDVEAMISELQVRVQTYVGDTSIIKRHKDVTKELSEKTALHDSLKVDAETKRVEIEEIEGVWKGKLKQVVEGIRVQYEKFFQRLKCKGTVQLHEDEDFEKWGLNILVQFCNTGGLRELGGAAQQSGGEKSVSTMFFLLALQDVTTCPFRVVDEINQGMDQWNERAVFNQIVQCSTGKNLPQYFVVTPKLLPNLNFTPAVRTFVVMNGSWNLPQNEVELWDIVKAQQKLKADRALLSH